MSEMDSSHQVRVRQTNSHDSMDFLQTLAFSPYTIMMKCIKNPSKLNKKSNVIFDGTWIDYHRYHIGSLVYFG